MPGTHVRMEVAVTSVEIEHLKELNEDNERTLSNLLSGKMEDQARTEGKLPVSITPQEFLQGHESAVRIRRDLAVSLEKSKIKIERGKQLVVYLFVVGFVGTIGLSVGVRLARFGFTNWYTKIQLPLDRQNASDAQPGAPGGPGKVSEA